MTTTTTRLVDTAEAVTRILKAAQAGDLPIPGQVQIMDLHSRSAVTLFVANLDELTHWAIWLDQPIDDHPIAGRVHHAVDGEMFDEPIRVLAITKAAA